MALVGMSARYPWQPRLPVSVGAGALGPTYADFQAHIATLATNGVRAWTFSGTFTSAGAWRTTATAAPAGDMYGSSWSSARFLPDAQTSRVIQHGLPSQVVLNDQVAAGREIFYRYASGGTATEFNSFNRNGYTSLSIGGLSPPEQSSLLTELIYWDGTQAQRMVPSTGTGPTPYTW